MRDDLRGLPALNAAHESLIHITIPVGMLQCNCSIIGDPVTREALVVDPGDEVTRILELLGRRRLTVKAIVSTHAHIDHVGGLSKLHQYTGAPVLMHRDDLPLYQAMEMQASFLGVLPLEYSPRVPTRERSPDRPKLEKSFFLRHNFFLATRFSLAASGVPISGAARRTR